MPSLRTPPDLDVLAPSSYNDLNRREEQPERNFVRTLERAIGPDERDIRPQERNSAPVHRSDRSDQDRQSADLQNAIRIEAGPGEPPAKRAPERISAVNDGSGASERKGTDYTHPLIEGLFSKLPQPEAEWPLQARQKWLQTAAYIFDLMYAPSETESGELAIRVERSNIR